MVQMFPQPLDTTLAFKTICLSDALTGTDKCVAAAIIDSFNRRTGQCDPSFDRIAHLVGKSRRTVIRAVQRLERMRFVLKTRHGGHFHRNSYEPHWALFRQMEAGWAAKRATRHWGPEMSPSTVPKICHVAGGKDGTQTNLINESNETRLRADVSKTLGPVPATYEKGNSRKEVNERPAEVGCRRATGPLFNGSAAAARSAAERRWNGALMRRLVGTPDLYAKVIDAIDQPMQDVVTTAEMRNKGSGIRVLTQELAKRGTAL